MPRDIELNILKSESKYKVFNKAIIAIVQNMLKVV